MSGLLKKVAKEVQKLKTAYFDEVTFTDSSMMDDFLAVSSDPISIPTEVPLAETLLQVLILLRAQYWMYQHAHWQAAGNSFYGDHLLFERIYQNIQGEIDSVAERIMGIAPEGVNPLDPLLISTGVSAYIDIWVKAPSYLESVLLSEQDLSGLLSGIYVEKKDSPDWTLGVDDLIMSLADTHEKHIYLLKQRKKTAALGRKKKASSPKRILVSNTILKDFLKIGNSTLIRKCDKDLWKLTHDENGNQVIERLYQGDLLDY